MIGICGMSLFRKLSPADISETVRPRAKIASDSQGGPSGIVSSLQRS
jgi:hypothetical protein